MYPIGVIGPGSERLAERLAERLSRDGTVGVLTIGQRTDSDPEESIRSTNGGVHVESGDFDRYRAAGASVVSRYEKGGWRTLETDRDPRDRLHALAADCAFVIVEGTSTVGREKLPTVVLGEEPTNPPGTVLGREAIPEELDVEAVRQRLLETEPIETLDSLVEAIKESPQARRSGAIATFTGRVRAKEDSEDTPTQYLDFEKYEGVADDRMARIGADLEEREGIFEVSMHHRTGRIDDGEDIVFVVVLAGHRAEAFRTVEDGIDRLKAEVPIFKKEVTVDEEFWVHDRP